MTTMEASQFQIGPFTCRHKIHTSVDDWVAKPYKSILEYTQTIICDDCGSRGKVQILEWPAIWKDVAVGATVYWDIDG